MPTVILHDRALISVSGPDAEHFLQTIVTVDLDQLKPGDMKPGALLTPQGKILFDFLVGRHGEDGFVLETGAGNAADFQRRLMLYRLRAKVDISKPEESLVGVRWHDDSDASQTDSTRWLRDSRFAPPAEVWRHHGAVEATADEADWTAFRIGEGIPESGADYVLGDAFPHDVLLDQTGGVGFRKGCYVGQEVVSRMHHRGTARRRVLLAHADGPLPAPGADIVAGGKTAGTLGSSVGAHALALVRIDRVKDAMDAGLAITVDGTPLTLSIPAWASFGFPQTTAPDGA